MSKSRIGMTIAAAAVLTAWGATRLGAQTGSAAGAGGIAVVDVVRIFDECAQIKDLNTLLKDRQAVNNKEAEAKQKALAEKETELAAFDPTSADYATRRKELTRLQIEFSAWAQVTREDMKRDHFNWTRIVYEESVVALGEISKERGLSLVLQKREFKPDVIVDLDVEKLRQMIHGRGVVWANESMDITQAVIDRMDAKYKERGGRAKLSAGAGS